MVVSVVYCRLQLVLSQFAVCGSAVTRILPLIGIDCGRGDLYLLCRNSGPLITNSQINITTLLIYRINLFLDWKDKMM